MWTFSSTRTVLVVSRSAVNHNCFDYRTCRDSRIDWEILSYTASLQNSKWQWREALTVVHWGYSTELLCTAGVESEIQLELPNSSETLLVGNVFQKQVYHSLLRWNLEKWKQYHRVQRVQYVDLCILCSKDQKAGNSSVAFNTEVQNFIHRPEGIVSHITWYVNFSIYITLLTCVTQTFFAGYFYPTTV